uniref:O(6)-methylguanine-induced apoptosis 2 isoform X1 n=1 Tax=Solea senegalensis TaxID=28829 RepID=UPI001CD87E30|nr:O(6)-methylguanine-induced apoptosis 2 isoform X1 [Solea senegalensis]
MVITNPEKKGFSSQAKRFPSQISLDDSPGPGSYCSISSTEVISPSFSKKGTTGFVASKVAKGYSNPQRSIPGPNKYNLQSSFINKYDFNMGVSRVFRLPLAVQLGGLKHIMPAPNQYDVCTLSVSCGSGERISSVFGSSAFISRTGRGPFCPNKYVPSPCHYDVSSHSIQRGSKAVLSPFKSKTKRIPALVDNHVPGPGAYSPHQAPAPVKKTILPRACCLTIAEPPVIVPKNPPFLGPGQYDIGSYDGVSKHPMPTAAFASKTERVFKYSQGDTRPGPGFYDPQILSKQSFIYNDSSVWIPV